MTDKQQKRLIDMFKMMIRILGAIGYTQCLSKAQADCLREAKKIIAGIEATK